jgi:predicted HTH domain antitoxin
MRHPFEPLILCIDYIRITMDQDHLRFTFGKRSFFATECLPQTWPLHVIIRAEVQMAKVTIDLPDGAFSAIRRSPQEFVKEMRIAASLLWYSQGEISQSKAAEIAGTSRARFIDELAHRRIPLVQATLDELKEEMERE